MQVKKELFAASEPDQHLVLDLSIFHAPHCQLKRSLWREVPVEREGGPLVERQAPAGHTCRAN